MSPVQTSYAAEHDKGFAGQRANLGIYNSFSKAAEGGAIGFGLAVVAGTADDQAKLPAASGERFLGLTEYTTAWAAGSDDIHEYEQYREMNIVDLGLIYVIPETSVVPGDKVFFRHTAPGAEVIGALRNDNDGGNADLIEGATFESTTSAGGVALVKLRGSEPANVVFDDATVVDADISVASDITLVDTTLGASASAMADGYEGQRKIIKMVVDGGDMVITPANFFDGTTITLNDAGDVVDLVFVDGNWHLISNTGATIA